MAESSPPVAPAAVPPAIEVRRSTRRRRTVAAYREGDKIVILMPARTSKAEEHRLITEMVDRVTRREARMASVGARGADSRLMHRARQLSAAYLDGRAQPISVRWVTNMQQRWGSCTVSDRTIRLSHRLQSMPSWVIDYVLMHELSHLLEPGHGRAFWAWVGRYPRTERARGFLEGVAVAAQLPEFSDCDSPGSSGLAEDEPEPAEVSSSAPDPADVPGSSWSVPGGWGREPAAGGGVAASAAGIPGSVTGVSESAPLGRKLPSSGSSSSGIRRS